MNSNKNTTLLTTNKGLLVPNKYYDLITSIDKYESNGCGSKDILGAIIPDSLYGLDILSACDIHDLMYSDGGTDTDREEADNLFLENMNRLIDKSKSNKLIKVLRIVKSKIYYMAVRLFGHFYFKKLAPVNL